MFLLSLYHPQTNNVQRVKATEEQLVFHEESSYVMYSKESGKVIEISNFGMYNGDQLQQWEYTKEESQQWQIKAEGKYYKFINKNSKKVLTTTEDAKNGDRLFQWDDTNQDTQLWYLEKTDNEYYKIKSKVNDMCIDIVGISKKNGAKLQLWKDSNGNNQKWKFTEIQENKKIVSGAKYKIVSKNSGKAVEVGYNSQENGGTVQQWKYEQGSNQQWFLEKVEDKYFKIIADHSGKVLTVKNAKTENGTLVEQRDYAGTDNQLWYFSEDPDGYHRIKSKQSQKALDVKGKSKENGALLQIWQNDDGDNQKWSLEMVSYQTYPTVNLYVYYDDETKQITANWDSTEDLVESKLCVRYDKEAKFKNICKKTQEQAVEEEQEDTVSYEENVPTDSIKEQIEFRVVGVTKYGKKITSQIVSLKKTEENTLDEMVIDTDKDGIADGYEIWDLSTDPYQADTDGDGFLDGYEVLTLCTNPLETTKNEDFDGDGLSNQEEMKLKTNPYLEDTDLDGINDKEDDNPLKTDVNTGKKADCNLIIPTGYYDKKICGYDEEGEYYEYIYNTLLNVYRYSQTGEENKIYNLYDIQGNQTANISLADGKSIINTYEYDENGNITYVTHNGFAYEFAYDENNNMTKTTVGGQKLISVTYDSQTNAETSVEYGNGNKKEYIYDKTGTVVTGIKIDGTLVYEYQYDADGNLKTEKDNENGVTYSYGYDEIGNLITIKADNGFSVVYQLDDNGEKQKTAYCFDGNNKTEQITEEEGSIITDLGSNGKSVVKRDQNKKQIQFQIYNNQQKKVVERQIVFTDENYLELKNKSNDNICYQYDKNKNLIAICKNNTEISDYTYDASGQLIRENNKETGKTIIYDYDEGGNLILEKVYPYTATEKVGNLCKENMRYAYTDKKWKDLLTEYCGEKITYDELGNPLQYVDGKCFTWIDGRKLATIQDKQNKIQYFYNDNSQRIKKIVNGKKTEYHWDEEKIIFQKDENGSIYFLYDAENNLIGLEKDGKTYYYEKDALNNIVALYNENGEKVVAYYYDTWGNLLDIDGDKELGNANPFRYRSYYYDNESKFYYLQNRYYDSKVKRFLNADQYLSLQEENLLSYAKNNPLKYMDSSGNAVETVIDILSAGWSFVDLVRSPSWIHLGFLAWDVGAVFVPFVPGSYVEKGGAKLIKVASKSDDFKDARYLVIGCYSKVKKVFRGCKNVDVHHIIEKRFLKTGKMACKARKMMSVPLEKSFHKEITQRWRRELPYGINYKTLSKNRVRKAINVVYHDMPALKKYGLKYLDEVWKE